MKTRAGEAQKRNYAFECLVKWDEISSCEQGQWPRERLVKVRHILMTIMNSLECFPDKNDLFRSLVIWCASACLVFTVIPQILQWAKPLMWLASMFFFISFMTPCFPHNLQILAFPCEFPVRLHNAMVSVSHICLVSSVHARVEREVAWMNLHWVVYSKQRHIGPVCDWTWLD